MQVSVKKNHGLQHQLIIQLPAEQFDNAYQARLSSMSRQVKVSGFRPGKVPLKVVQQKYGHDVEQEVINDMIRHSYRQALQQQKLQPAGAPVFDAKPRHSGEAFEYTVTFEVYPEIVLGDMKKLKLQQAVVEISNEDVERILQRLREQRAEWLETARKATQGDRVELDFEGFIDGEGFEGGKGEKVTVEIGANQMIEDFERQLTGSAAGEARRIKVKFPKDYQQVSLAGKKAEFALQIHRILEKKLPEVDESFVKSYGVEDGSLPSLDAELRRHLELERQQHIKTHLKKQVINGLLEMHQFELPSILIDQEAEALLKQSLRRLGLKNVDASTFPREPFQEEGQRRVKLGLIFGEIIKENQLKADGKEVKAHIERIAASYEKPAEVVQHYYANKDLLQSAEAAVLEDTVVNWVLKQAQLSDRKMDLNTLTEACRA